VFMKILSELHYPDAEKIVINPTTTFNA